MKQIEFPTANDCPHCGSKWRKLGPPCGPHAGSSRCLQCNAWDKWLSKEKVAALRKCAERAAECQD